MAFSAVEPPYKPIYAYIYIYIYLYIYIYIYIFRQSWKKNFIRVPPLKIIYRFIGRFNCRQGHVFMVRTKPSKQPLGLVAHGVPIEKVRAKWAMHSDWACGAAGTPKGCLGRSNFGQGHVFMGRLNFRQGHIYRLFGGGENFFLSLFKFTL